MNLISSRDEQKFVRAWMFWGFVGNNSRAPSRREDSYRP